MHYLQLLRAIYVRYAFARNIIPQRLSFSRVQVQWSLLSDEVNIDAALSGKFNIGNVAKIDDDVGPELGVRFRTPDRIGFHPSVL